MLWKGPNWQSGAVLCTIALIALAVIGGCSSVEPSDPWVGETGSVSGTVRDDGGAPVAEMEVWLWAELEPDGIEVRYNTSTDEAGWFEMTGIEVPDAETCQQNYEMCANRTPYRSTSIDEVYDTYYATVTVERGATCVADVVVAVVDDGPGDPDIYIGN